MFDRFVEFRSANGIDCIISGTRMPIVGYGKLHVNVMQNGEHRTIELFNVAYVPDYLTNLVSIDLAKRKGVYFDNRRMMLYIENNKLFCDVKAYGAHYLIEDNTKGPPSESPNLLTNFVVKQATEADWHSILGHASAEAIQHLEASTEGVKILQSTEVTPRTPQCEPCALSKLKKIVSYSSDKSDPLTRPFERISFDLIQFNSAYNSHQWTLHVACDFTDFNLVWMHQYKTDASHILLNVVQLIKK